MSGKSEFIASTAKDYDMEYETVESFYNSSPVKEEFYEKLEAHIKDRAGFMNSIGEALQGKPVDNKFMKANLE